MMEYMVVVVKIKKEIEVFIGNRKKVSARLISLRFFRLFYCIMAILLKTISPKTMPLFSE